MTRLKIAVFASGSGSNFQAIVDRIADGSLHAHICLLVSDQPQSYVVKRARDADIRTFAFQARDYRTREDYEADILQQLRVHGVDMVVLAGYMRLITKVLIEPYDGKMINIHPSLLPAFPGIDAIGQALQYGV